MSSKNKIGLSGINMTEIDAIKSRHSVRKYLDRQIEPEKIEKLNERVANNLVILKIHNVSRWIFSHQRKIQGGERLLFP